jgi:hypothetical protein
MRASDVVPALLMLVLSAAFVIDTWTLEFYGETTPGPAFLPVWLAIAGGVLFVLRVAEARRLGGGLAVEWPGRDGLRRVILTFAGLIVVPVVTPFIGMIPAMMLFMAYLLLVVLRQRLGPSLATIAVTGGVVYAIFVRWLGIALPAGLLGI